LPAQSQTASGPRSDANAGKPTPSPATSATVVLHEEAFIACLLLREEYDGPTSYAIRLDKDNHDLALVMLPQNAQIDYATAAQHANTRTPFTPKANRHGIKKLRRNEKDGAITAHAAHALEAIACAATLRALDENDVNEYLITDADIPPDLLEQLGGCENPQVVYSRT